MPSNFDLPTGNKQDLGDALCAALDEDRYRALAPVIAQATAVKNYLDGNRYFEVEDPWNRGYTLLRVSNPVDQPAYEMVVGDVAEELGRQLRIDVRPGAGQGNLSLGSLRKAAVANGVLNYHFPIQCIGEPHAAFQKYRVEDGVAGLSVSETWWPGTGWGLQVEAIPAEELLFLPANTRSWGLVKGLCWRRWVPLKWLRAMISRVNVAQPEEKRIRIPAEGSDDYKRMLAVEVMPGQSIRQALEEPAWGLAAFRTMGYEASNEQKSSYNTVFVPFTQAYVTPNHRHLERQIFMVGRHVIYDRVFREDEMPMVPISRAVYADVGGPRGRSYAYPKVMANLLSERILMSLARNAGAIDAYGMLMYSTSMGVNLEQLDRPSNGDFRVGTYTMDPASPGSVPIQFEPAPLGKIYGNLPQLMLAASGQVYPKSPLFQGKAPGRVDSDKALDRLDILSGTQIAAGMTSAAACWSQIYCAGLEMARNHYAHGERVPILLPDENMVGVVLDTEESPQSMEEVQAQAQRVAAEDQQAASMGLDPGMTRMMRRVAGTSASQQPRPRVPVGRFTIGPNVIPHPDEVAISIRSLMPRDEEKEFMGLVTALKLGAMSVVEMQIECYKRGLNVPIGGRSAWNAYRLAILNLLSAYGDGIEAGPVVLPVAASTQRIGGWVVRTFMDSPEYVLASQTVQNRIQQLAQAYGPANQAEGIPTVDEVAMMEQMRQQAAVRGMRPGAATPQPGSGNGQSQGMNRG